MMIMKATLVVMNMTRKMNLTEWTNKARVKWQRMRGTADMNKREYIQLCT